MGDYGWVWIPIVLFAAAAQTVRNTAQSALTKTAGTLAATSVRFIYGLPFAVIALAVIGTSSRFAWPQANAAFLRWAAGGAMAQLVATALLLAAMQRRSFVVALAYSKTEVLQVALFSVVLLGEHLTAVSTAAIVIASAGVILMSVKRGSVGLGLLHSWLSPAALLGVASGAGFAISAVAYRAATLSLGPLPPWFAGAYTLVWAQAIQSVTIAAYLAVREPKAWRQITSAWRVSLLAGLAGAVASFGWFTAFAMRNAADVRALALVEVLYGYLVSRRLLKEKTTHRELAGLTLLLIGIVIISAGFRH